jgi:probable addiction module antidote protein
MPKTRTFDAARYRDNPKMIAKYLNDALATGDAAVSMKAIGTMVRAQGATRFSQKAGLRREGLYRSFKGNPGFETVIKVLLALEIQLVAKPSAGSSRSDGKRRENEATAGPQVSSMDGGGR